MSKSALEAAKNSLLASGNQIPATTHRQFEQLLIDDLYDAQKRGDVLAALSSVAGNQDEDLFFVIRGGVAVLVSGLTFPTSHARGAYDASSNLYPASGGSGLAGAIKAGDWWHITVVGTLGGVKYPLKTILYALEDDPGQDSTKWREI